MNVGSRTLLAHGQSSLRFAHAPSCILLRKLDWLGIDRPTNIWLFQLAQAASVGTNSLTAMTSTLIWGENTDLFVFWCDVNFISWNPTATANWIKLWNPLEVEWLSTGLEGCLVRKRNMLPSTCISEIIVNNCSFASIEGFNGQLGLRPHRCPRVIYSLHPTNCLFIPLSALVQKLLSVPLKYFSFDHSRCYRRCLLFTIVFLQRRIIKCTHTLIYNR